MHRLVNTVIYNQNPSRELIVEIEVMNQQHSLSIIEYNAGIFRHRIHLRTEAQREHQQIPIRMKK